MKMIIGSDEVGTGAVAGPIYVVAVAAPITWSFPKLRDSKKLSRAQREAIFDPLLLSLRGNWTVSTQSAQTIDRIGHFRALRDAHVTALKQLLKLYPRPHQVIVDGNLELPIPRVQSIPKADDKFQAVSAASVLAKVLRDEEMEFWEGKFPHYSFGRHRGYLTELHLRELREWGLSELHRKSCRVNL